LAGPHSVDATIKIELDIQSRQIVNIRHLKPPLAKKEQEWRNNKIENSNIMGTEEENERKKEYPFENRCRNWSCETNKKGQNEIMSNTARTDEQGWANKTDHNMCFCRRDRT
jgi:hypothetical protein